MTTQPRQPIVGGVAGGVGTSIVAALIGGYDAGQVAPGQPVDVLVCRSVSSHLSAATRLAAHAPQPPVVVISADVPSRPPHQVKERARMLEPNVAAVLWLAWVDHLRAMPDPPRDLRDAVLAADPASWTRPVSELRSSLITAVVPLVSTVDTTTVPAEPLRRTS